MKTIADLPYYIGYSDSPQNPDGLPSTWPFTFGYDAARGLLRQYSDSSLLELLDRTYRCGRLIGTPLADDPFGKPYADDFLDFIGSSVAGRRGRGLEIGAGTGYLTRRLEDAGWDMTAIEPGEGYRKHWERYQIEVIEDFFPTEKATGPFDLICGFLVLEHIPDPVAFLCDVRRHLADGGVAAFAVPDCTEEIQSGDPAILVHEHFSFFDVSSLSGVFLAAGLSCKARGSGFGRCLYASGSSAGRSDLAEADPGRPDCLASYPERALRYSADARKRLESLGTHGTVGIFCPGRGLAVMNPASQFRFFDDDPALSGRYFPPFSIPIETRGSLVSRPVDTLVVMSRTFGARIRSSLRAQGYQHRILPVNELVGGSTTSDFA